MFLCWRSFYPVLNEKVFLFHCKCCIETRFSRCSSQEFAAFTEHVDITVLLITCNASREISEFFSLSMLSDFFQAKFTQVIRSFLICEKLPSLLYQLVSFPIFLDCVTASLFFASEHVHGARFAQFLGLNITPRSFVSGHVVRGEKCGLGKNL